MTLCPSCQTKHRGQSAEQHIEGQDRKNNHADKVHRAAGLHLGAEFIHDTAVRLVGNIVNGIVPAQAVFSLSGLGKCQGCRIALPIYLIRDDGVLICPAEGTVTSSEIVSSAFAVIK